MIIIRCYYYYSDYYYVQDHHHKTSLSDSAGRTVVEEGAGINSRHTMYHQSSPQHTHTMAAMSFVVILCPRETSGINQSYRL